MTAELVGEHEGCENTLAEGLPLYWQECELCHLGDDQYCPKAVMTYNGKDWADSDAPTYGGYSNRYVVNHK